MKEIIRAAFVIGRRDLTAIIFSKAFILFLLGPLFPLIVGIAAGKVGGEIARDSDRPVVGIAMSQSDTQAMIGTRDNLAKQLGEQRYARMKPVALPADAGKADLEKQLFDKKANLVAIISGTPKAPVLTATVGKAGELNGQVAMVAAFAATGQSSKLPPIRLQPVVKSAGDSKQMQMVTGQGAQFLMYFLTVLLTGMVLSNLVEEKSNKIIEILAASIPIESVFIGKLFAMLLMAFIGITLWSVAGYAALQIVVGGLPNFPTPAVGWPTFMALGITYFTMAYLMLGAMFLGIGAQAATVREVQTLSMPVTMIQLIIFFFAAYSVTKLGQPIEQAACIFPFSSPFAMIARSAQDATLWYHAVAIVGQLFFAILLLRIGVNLFKRNVMKSGNAGRVKDDGKRRLFGLVRIPG